MAIRDIFKVSWRTFFNPVSWVDYQALKQQNQTFWIIITDLFRPAKPQRQETFEEARTRLQLSAHELKERGKAYRHYAQGFLLLTVLAFIYAIYLFVHYHTIAGLIIGCCAAILLLTQAFRYSFWSYQIRSKKLGVSAKEWRQHFFSREKSI